jgi:hypothetical protein
MSLAGAAAAGGLGASMVMGASSASASPARSALVTTASAGGRHQTVRKAPNPTSTSNAGYIGNTTGPTTLSATFKVPVFSCATGTDTVFIGLFANGSVGDNATGSGGQIVVNCDGTTPSYSATVFADDGPNSSLTVSPGDKVVYTGSAGPTSESYTVADAKTHQTATATGTGMGVENLQFTTQGGFSDTGGFATFKAIKYTKISVDGGPLSALTPGPLDQVDGSGAIMIKTGKLNKAGNGFALKFVSDS